MLLVKYPNKKSVIEDRTDSIKNSTNFKKAKNNLIKNCILSVVIIALSFLIKNIFFMILCILVAFYPLLMSAYSFRYIALLNKKNLETLIYDDKIIHCQYNLFLSKLNKYIISYSDIEYTTQDLMGNLVMNLNSSDVHFKQIYNKTEKTRLVKNNIIKLNFIENDAKYFLIKKMSKHIKYK